ncbi:MAG TPA: hypothetical protein VFI39_06665 [Gemmatimonadales bacterium]|nr:hypothetical protein [Gemmatimonadales bacterium]
MTAPLSRNGLTLIRCRAIETPAPATPATVPACTLTAIARGLRYGARQRQRVLISDRMATFLADLLDERAQAPVPPVQGAS